LARIDTIHVAAAITNTRVIVGERANRRRSAEVPNGMAVRVQVRGSSASSLQMQRVSCLLSARVNQAADGMHLLAHSRLLREAAS
jgi:hypothetical protein